MRKWPWLCACVLVLACGDSSSPGDGANNGDGSHAGDATSDPRESTPCTFTKTTYEGEGTYYDADGSGNCGFPATPDDLLVGAMNHTDYADSAACGTCVAIEGPEGAVHVRIVDQCPECAPGDIDLSLQAFERISPRAAGRVAIRWHYEPCPVRGGVIYHFKDGSNPWWVAIQVRNHRRPVAKLEAKGDDGSFRELTRVDYNYFVADDGLGEGPFTFRLTDAEGATLVSSGVPLGDDKDAPTREQLPGCM